MTGRAWLESWAEDVAADPENAHVGRFSRFVVRLRDDEGGDVALRYDGGTVTLGDGADVTADIELRAPGSAWRELVNPRAAPRRHDLLALTKAPHGITIEAGRDHLIRHLRVITRLVELGKAHG